MTDRSAASDGVVLRAATEADAAAVLSFYVALLDEGLPYVLASGPPTLDAERAFLASHDGEQAQFVLAVRGASVLGTIGLRRGAHRQHAHVCSFGLSVAAAHRGRGLGTRLIAAGEVWCRERGVRRLELEVIDGNPAVALYERLGFEHEGRRRGAVAVGGLDRDVLLMARRLGGPRGGLG